MTGQLEGPALVADAPLELPRANAARAVKATTLSFIWPGLGEAYAGRRLPYVLAWAVPPLVLIGVLLAWVALDPASFATRLLAPSFALSIVLLIAALPTWPYSTGWGYYPSGGLGLILVIILLVVLLR